MTLKARVFTGQAGKVVDIAPDRLSDVVHKPDAVVWVHLIDASPADLATLRSEFHVPPLILEDIGQDRQRPRFRVFRDRIYIVIYALAINGQAVDSRQFSIFSASNYVITACHANFPDLGSVSERFDGDAEEIGLRDAVVLLYSMLDIVVDGYREVLDQVVEWVDDVGERILAGQTAGIQREMVDLRRTLLKIRRITEPEVGALTNPVRHENPAIDARMIPYFYDIQDHLVRSQETIDYSLELLASSLESYNSNINNQLNVVVRRLTSSSIILMSMALIPAVYGMNFHRMPELKWALGYPWALGLMLVIGVTLTLVFRRARWL